MYQLMRKFVFLLLFVSLCSGQQSPGKRTVPMEPLPEEPVSRAPLPTPKPVERATAPKVVEKPMATFEDSLRRQAESVARQVQALQEQNPNFWRSAPLAAAPDNLPAEPFEAANCPPVPTGDLRALVDREAKKQAISSTLLHAVIEQESGNLPCAVSSKGAMGLMQLMPATAQTLQVKDPFDPGQNIAAGSRFLKSLLDRYKGDLPKALAAYNAGPGRVDQAGEVPNIPETQNYVERILARIAAKEQAIQ